MNKDTKAYYYRVANLTMEAYNDHQVPVDEIVAALEYVKHQLFHAVMNVDGEAKFDVVPQYGGDSRIGRGDHDGDKN